MKRRHWWVHFPGDVYGMDFRFDEPVSERHWRAWLRQHWGLKRLPRGTSVWGYA